MRSYFPVSWKIAIVNPIPKVTCPTDLSEFRPISILPSLSKVLERLMKNQLQEFLLRNEMLYPMQSGFRPKHSTTTALLKITDDISTALDSGQVVVASLLDFRKAFDVVNHDRLLLKLRSLFKISGRGCNFIKSYLTDRTQKVRVGSKLSELVAVTSGTPQGGILSALLFCLFINDLPTRLNASVHLYADDSTIYCTGPAPDLNHVVYKMNSELIKVEAWAKTNDVLINPSKSQAIIFSKNKIPNPPPIYIGTSMIPQVSEAKLLGFMLSSNLSLDTQITKMCGEIQGILHMLYKSQSFISVSVRLRLVKALIVPKFLYCAEIYVGCSRSMWDKLNLTFNSCLRYIFNVRKFTSVSLYLDKLFGCPLENYLQYRACVFLFNLLRTSEPNYLYSNINFPRHRRNGLLSLPAMRVSTQRNASFFVLGVRLWNYLNTDIRASISVAQFKERCLSFFTSKKM